MCFFQCSSMTLFTGKFKSFFSSKMLSSAFLYIDFPSFAYFFLFQLWYWNSKSISYIFYPFFSLIVLLCFFSPRFSESSLNWFSNLPTVVVFWFFFRSPLSTIYYLWWVLFCVFLNSHIFFIAKKVHVLSMLFLVSLFYAVCSLISLKNKLRPWPVWRSG